MAPLTAHQSGDHDRIGFHPDCPVCRQDRLFGVFSPDPVFSRRLRVVLATGVLALSTVAAGTSVATEPDNQQEGVVLPEQGAPPSDDATGDTAPDQPPDDLGQGSGGETALPFEVDPVPAGPQDGPGDDSGDAAPLETEPTVDPDAGLLLSGPDTIAPDDAPVPPAEPVPPTTPAPPSVPAPEPGAPAAPDETAPPAEERDERATTRPRERRVPKHHKRRTRQHARGAPEPTTDAVPAPTPVQAPAEPVTQVAEPAPTAETTPTPSPARLGHFHVVRPGESLWSIATNLLGPEASASAIVIEVRRLWKLNEKRIGTGDPNLLVVGVKLRLR